ncbi:hypothetical protein FVER14953_20940 [Fusarium verticillioides]|nr:hypothetical protein FVER14953_20940 [Fusarium verticillioides]
MMQRLKRNQARKDQVPRSQDGWYGRNSVVGPAIGL